MKKSRTLLLFLIHIFVKLIYKILFFVICFWNIKMILIIDKFYFIRYNGVGFKPNSKSMFERKFIMKNIENFAVSDAALEEVVGGVDFKSSKVKKILTYTGIVLGGGLAFTATAIGSACVGEKLTPMNRISNTRAYGWIKDHLPKING